MPDNEKSAFSNIDYNNITVSKPLPDKLNSIDTDGILFDNIIAASSEHDLNLPAINSFNSVSRTRDNI